MRLTDDEIREILIKEKLRKRKIERRKRRIRFLVFLVLFISLVIFFVVKAVGAVSDSPSRWHSKDKTEGVIFIDAGHGGMDGGSVYKKRLEKNDTLKLALAVRDKLEKMNYKVYMSRTDDEDVDRDERALMANRRNADLMVSIHRNKAEEGSGVEAYIPSSDDSDSRLLAENILKALSSIGFDERAITAGSLLSADEDYAENEYSEMPSCLVEVGFMQNKADNKLFDEKLDEIAEAIAEAIQSTMKTTMQ